jgi:hypothetical protein
MWAEQLDKREPTANLRLGEILRQSAASLEPDERRALLLGLEKRMRAEPADEETHSRHLAYIIQAWALYFAALSEDECRELLKQLRRELHVD